MNPANVFYHIQDSLHDYFFMPELREQITLLSRFLNHQYAIDLFPDAMFKSLGLPNGMAISSPKTAGMIFPALLRDPGCGFLLFKLQSPHKLTQAVQRKIGNRLEQVLFQEKDDPPFIDVFDILKNGLYAFSTHEIAPFCHSSFNVNEDFSVTAEEMKILQKDWWHISNTVELKQIVYRFKEQPSSLHENDMIGFIHTGGEHLPSLLQHWLASHRLRYENAIQTSPALMQAGIYGIEIQSEFGQGYIQWLHAAMNFCLAKRYHCFLSITALLENEFDCEVSLINDRLHAGIFDDPDEDRLIATRGVQFLPSNHHPLQNLLLLAGHRETISYLVSAKNKAHPKKMIAHGTSYYIHEGFDYANHFSKRDLHTITSFSKQTYYNSQINPTDCIPLTFNIFKSLQYFFDYGYIDPVAILKPLVNLQAPSLIKRLQQCQHLHLIKQ